MRSICRSLLLALLLLPSPARAAAAWAPLRSVEGIAEYRLPNGLQLLLAPDASKPTTTVNLTYRVGSRHENYGETGMAHLLEHLLFKGSPRHRQPWAEFARRGLKANGSTWLDRTNYFASFAANDANLQWYLDWQADAMVNSFIARRDLDTEMTVVRNEMEMGENSPGRIVFERLLATMYQWHNYGKSTIGARSDVENVDIGRLQAFYRTYYQPDNATLIVSGKFEPARVLAWVRASFGRIPAPQRALPRLYTVDPAQDGERMVTLRRVGGVASVNAAYHVPPGPLPDYAAVELLSLLLAEAPDGRLHKQLVEGSRLAASVSAFAMPLADPGFLLLGAELAPQRSQEALSQQLLQVVEGLARAPVSEDELRRAKSRWLNRWEQQFSDPEQVGVALSESVAQGDWRLFFLLRDRVRALSAADLQRVAEAYLIPANRTLAHYVPSERPQRAPAPALADVAAQLRDFRPAAAQAAVAAFDASPANIDRLTQTSQLAGGLQLALLPKATRGGAVQGVMTLRMGDAASLQGLQSVADLSAALLDKGTLALDRQQLRDRLDALKVELQVQGEADAVSIAWSTRREHAAEAAALIAEMLRRPRLAPEALEEVRAQALAALQAARDDPEALAENALERAANRHPRGDPRHARSFDEIEADLRAVTPQQLRDFHARFYGAGHAQLALVGDFDAGALRDALGPLLADWRAPAAFTRLPQPLTPLPGSRQTLLTPDKQNAVLGAQLALPVSDAHADYAALTMANHLLGGGGNSRLWKRIREQEGLSYDVGSSIAWRQQDLHSVWQLSAIFAPQNRARVEQGLREVLAQALQQGFTPAELAAGKQALLSKRRLGRAQDMVLAQALAVNLFLGRSMQRSQEVDDALAALTLAEVNAALRRYLRPEDFQFVLAGDFK